ncbi:hypothetical protein PRUPE_3G045900 [Prunus persica]|uniref:Uncharacterized protein n=1 Tax=Prunus persica TaxID=3760 RepID=A0A251PYG2_PRUPE|nr:hypothetical protein PRUPE_3G045900 [Prunus persica]
MWSSENPGFLRTLRTESGPSRLSNCTLLEAERASFGDNPHEFIRHETVKENTFSCSLSFPETNDDFDEYELKKIGSF